MASSYTSGQILHFPGKWIRGASAVVFIAVSTIAPSQAQETKHVPTIEELMRLETITSAEISPDGQFVAYLVDRADFENDKRISRLWRLNTTSGERVQLTYGDKSVRGTEWSPDSQWLAFLRDGKINLMRADGGEAKILDLEIKNISSFHFSPDGRVLALIASDKSAELREKREKHFGKFDVFREDGDYQQIWVVPLTVDMDAEDKDGINQLTRGTDFSVRGFTWSPDSKTIAYSATSSPHLADLLTMDISLLDVESGDTNPLVVRDGIDSNPHFSPDGKWIAFNSAPGFPDLAKIFVVPVSGGEPDPLSGGFDEDADIVEWRDDGIYFAGADNTALDLYRLNAATGEITRLVSPAGQMAYNFSFSDAGLAYAFVASGAMSLGEIYLASSGETRRLTDMTEQLAAYHLGDREVIRWSSDDGTTIEGVLHKPYNFGEGKKYPLYVVTHGGPTGTDRPWLRGLSRSYPVDVWSGKGALVLQVNYRGSASYGARFRRLNIRDLGLGPTRDIVAGINHLVGDGLVDESRIGCLGWSQGGHISAMLATHTDRCTAANMGAGISNWATYYYNTDITQFTTEYFGATPSEDAEIYRRTSPISYIGESSTPVLIQHGENDRRVPVANAFELRQALIDNDIPTRLIIYGNMGHGPNRPKTRLAIRTHTDAWFDHYLFDGPAPEFVRPDLPNDESDDGSD